MGFESKISWNTFPRQGPLQGRAVKVYFHYDEDNFVRGVCVRDDDEQPFLTLFKLADGRYVTADECQFQQLGETTEKSLCLSS